MKHAYSDLVEALLSYSQRKHLNYTQEQHYKFIADTLSSYMLDSYAGTERELMTSIEQWLSKD
jgi:hypothetical protein